MHVDALCWTRPKSEDTSESTHQSGGSVSRRVGLGESEFVGRFRAGLGLGRGWVVESEGKGEGGLVGEGWAVEGEKEEKIGGSERGDGKRVG